MRHRCWSIFGIDNSNQVCTLTWKLLVHCSDTKRFQNVRAHHADQTLCKRSELQTCFRPLTPLPLAIAIGRGAGRSWSLSLLSLTPTFPATAGSYRIYIEVWSEMKGSICDVHGDAANMLRYFLRWNHMGTAVQCALGLLFRSRAHVGVVFLFVFFVVWMLWGSMCMRHGTLS